MLSIYLGLVLKQKECKFAEAKSEGYVMKGNGGINNNCSHITRFLLPSCSFTVEPLKQSYLKWEFSLFQQLIPATIQHITVGWTEQHSVQSLLNTFIHNRKPKLNSRPMNLESGALITLFCTLKNILDLVWCIQSVDGK